MKRKLFLISTMILSMSFLLSSCNTANTESTSAGTEEQTTVASSEKLKPEDIKIGLVLAGGLGDLSFYDSANAGVERLNKEFGIEYQVYECQNKENIFQEQMVQAAEANTIVVAVGYEFTEITPALAKEFKDVDFIHVDQDGPEFIGVNNLIPVSYADNEGAFLAGAFAALMTVDTGLEGINEEKIVGMVGGAEIAVIKNFQTGYEAGAKYIDPETEVLVVYANDFEDPAKGKEAATSLYSQKADIIFHAAGKSGEGVISAGADLNQYVIGVDFDQRHINPDVVLASMIKETGNSIYDVVISLIEGTFKRGTLVNYDLAVDGVGLVYGDDTMPKYVKTEIFAKINEIKEGIIDGSIEVPSYTE